MTQKLTRNAKSPDSVSSRCPGTSPEARPSGNLNSRVSRVIAMATTASEKWTVRSTALPLSTSCGFFVFTILAPEIAALLRPLPARGTRPGCGRTPRICPSPGIAAWSSFTSPYARTLGQRTYEVEVRGVGRPDARARLDEQLLGERFVLIGFLDRRDPARLPAGR